MRNYTVTLGKIIGPDGVDLIVTYTNHTERQITIVNCEWDIVVHFIIVCDINGKEIKHKSIIRGDGPPYDYTTILNPGESIDIIVPIITFEIPWKIGARFYDDDGKIFGVKFRDDTIESNIVAIDTRIWQGRTFDLIEWAESHLDKWRNEKKQNDS